MKTPDEIKRQQRHSVSRRKKKSIIPFTFLNKQSKKPFTAVQSKMRTIFICHQPVQVQSNYFDNSK